MTSQRWTGQQLAGVTALATLLLSGLVLAFSWVVPFAPGVLAAAWLVAGIAMAVVVTFSIRQSRAEGVGFPTTVGRMFKDLGRFIFWFF